MKVYDDVFRTPGAVSWTEMATPDPKAATEFYGRLLGWTFDTMNLGQGEYHVIKVGDAAIGGLMAPMPGAPAMPPVWGPYITVADTDATAEQCKSLGGKLLAGPMDIPSIGRFAVLQDPQGAAFNVIAYLPPAS